MTALSEDKQIELQDGVEKDFPVAATEKIYGGALVCVNAAGYALEGSDTANLIFQGIAMNQKDNGSGANGDLDVVLRRRGLVKVIMDTVITIANVGDNVYLVDDQTVDIAANVTHNIFCGIIAGYIDTTHAWVDIEPAIRQHDVAAIYQHLVTAKGMINIPMPVITNAGVTLAAFANAADPLPGFCVTAEGLGIRWNNHATPTPVGVKVIIPPDADITANMTLHILAAKIGATAGDATKFTIEAFNNVVAALYDADADFGGDTGAMTGDAATKTVQHVTLTLALANLAAYPSAMELTLQPKDGTLGTDDVIMLAAWIEYQKKLLTS